MLRLWSPALLLHHQRREQSISRSMPIAVITARARFQFLLPWIGTASGPADGSGREIEKKTFPVHRLQPKNRPQRLVEVIDARVPI